MDGVKVALGGRGMTVKASRRCAKDRKEWRALVQLLMILFNAAIFAWPHILSELPPSLWLDYHPERGGMPLG